MKLLRQYLRERRRTILAWALVCAIFFGTFALYRLPLAAVAYPALLCTLLGLGFGAADLIHMRKKHAVMERLCALPAELIEQLPPPESQAEEDCRRLIAALQEQLRALTRETAARDRERLDYYSIWVHQIKTPIAAMQLALENEDGDAARALRADLLRIEQYVQMALAFLRLDSDTSDYVFRRVPLDPIIRQTAARFAPEFIGRRLTLDYEPITAEAVTDEKWLAFILEQVLSNALKYTRQGGIRIYLQPPLTLCVADTGIGIAAADLPRVFEKGYTGGNGRIDQRASGLGLYLCRKIGDKLGVQIAIASEPGRGTTVSICLEQYPMRGE